jgi:urease accessory protein
MQAMARIVAEPAAGRTRCTTLLNEPPLTFRETTAGLTWVGTAAGPVGGDELHVEVRVEPAAVLSVGSAGASIVLPGVTSAPSRVVIDVSVAAGASLCWHTEPTVLAAGADHIAVTTITLGAGADLVWVEELVLGRHAEAAGRLSSRLAVDGPRGPVLRTGLEIGAPGWDGPAVTSAHRAHAQIVLSGAPARRVEDVTLDDVDWTVARLRDGAVVFTIIADEPRHMRAAVAHTSSAGLGGRVRL